MITPSRILQELFRAAVVLACLFVGLLFISFFAFLWDVSGFLYFWFSQ